MEHSSKNQASWKCAIAALGALGALLLAGCADHTGAGQPYAGAHHYIDGAMAYDRGDTAVAASDLKQAVKENPNLTMAYILLGDIDLSQSDYRTASDHLEQAVKLDPYGWKNHYDLGVAYQFLHRLQEAAGEYLRSLKLEPNEIHSMMNLGLVYLALDQPADALAMMRKAVELNPNSAAAHINLGVVLEKTGDPSGAAAQYRDAIELDPNSNIALLDLGQNLIHQGSGKDAVLIMKKVVGRNDTPETRKLYGDALVIDGKDDDAYQQYDIAYKRDPHCYSALNEAGMILIRKYQSNLTLNEPQRRQAVAVWRKSLEIKPDQSAIAALVEKWNQGGKVLP